jgi:hypothetical protein
MIQMPRAAAISTMRPHSARGITSPVGLQGELTMMARVRGVTERSNSPAVMAKPSCPLVSTITGRPPEYTEMSRKVTQ